MSHIYVPSFLLSRSESVASVAATEICARAPRTANDKTEEEDAEQTSAAGESLSLDVTENHSSQKLNNSKPNGIAEGASLLPRSPSSISSPGSTMCPRSIKIKNISVHLAKLNVSCSHLGIKKAIKDSGHLEMVTLKKVSTCETVLERKKIKFSTPVKSTLSTNETGQQLSSSV